MKNKMKGFLIAIVFVMLMSVTSTQEVSAASWKNFRGIKWSIDTQTGQLTIAPGVATKDYEIGDMGDRIESYECWSSRGNEVYKIVIEDGVSSIGNNAFDNMKNLTEVTIADSVKTIGEYAFQGNVALMSVDMGNGVEKIGQGSFQNCTKLPEVSMPDSIRSIGKNAFLDTAFVEAQKNNEIIICDNVVLGNNLEALGTETCIIPKGTTCIADHAFEGTTISTLEFPASLRYIGKYAFSDRSQSSYDMKVKKLDLYNVVSVDNGAFRYWHDIESVDLTNVTYLGSNAFYFNNRLKSVELAENMDFIGENVFSACKVLETIEVPKSVKSVDTTSFDCRGAANDKIYHDEDKDGFYYHEGMLLKAKAVNNINYGKDIVVEDGTYIIANRAFYEFNPTDIITSITIPESVKYIGNIAFSQLDLKDVYYAGSKNSWKEIQIENEIVFSNAQIHYGKVSETNISNCTVQLEYSKIEHTGSKITPNVTVKSSDGVVLEKNVDYKVTYENNVNVGTATVKITGLGNYSGTVTRTFKITSTKSEDVTVELSYSKISYDGNQKTPTIIATDSYGNRLMKDTDYTVTFEKAKRKSVGQYYVTVKFKGNYTGSQKKYFIITPKAPSSISASLYSSYNKVKVSWKKCTGASGYAVYYKKFTEDDSKYKRLTRTTKLSYTKSSLASGTGYDFKVVPYYKKKISGKTNYFESEQYKSKAVWTLKKIDAPVIEKNGTKVKVSWKNIDGESGYQISKATSKKKTSIVSTYSTTTGEQKTISATKGKTYYYKVRAYKTVNGKKIYGPWSNAVRYVRK